MDHHDASKLEPPSSREEPPEWRRAHDDLTQLAKTRAHLDWQEGRSLRSALKTGAHLQLGFASFAEYIERLFGYTARWTAERLRVAEALDRLPEIDQALRDSALNWSAVRELTRVAVPENEHQWLALARGRSLRHSAKISNRRTCVATPGHSAHPAHHHLRLSIPSVAAAKLTPRRGSY
jgi:hypothetical protein